MKKEGEKKYIKLKLNIDKVNTLAMPQLQRRMNEHWNGIFGAIMEMMAIEGEKNEEN